MIKESMSIIDTILNVWILLIKILVLVVSHTIHKFFGIRIFLKNFEDDNDFKTCLDNAIYDKIIHANDISEIASIQGYIIREHVVATKDEYLLVIHKLEKRDGGITNANGKIAYFHHGLLTNSELFILGTKKEKSLPFLLVDLGYEVWLGNNRGNKYSRKHLKYSVCDKKFWNFSLDEFALYDIPDTIDYILSLYPPHSTLTYIGFSQGCSQLFASLSLKPELNSKLNMFIALSPAVIPNNLKHPIFKIIVRQAAKDNNFLYSLFGERALMPSVSFWSYVMGSRLYERVVDTSLTYLFGWSGNNIGALQKRIGYPHMFSNASVKCLTHWFQIINSKRFQMFDETCKFGVTNLAVLSSTLKSKSHCVAPFPVSHHLNLPIILVYGNSDILVDIELTKKLITDQNLKMKNNLIDTIECSSYEHMDPLWANDVYEKVFSKVINAMESMHNKRFPNRLSIDKYNNSNSSLHLSSSHIDSLYS